MSYDFETQIQQQKAVPVTLLTQVSRPGAVLPPLVGQSGPPDLRLAMADAFNNLRLAESNEGASRSVLLTSFSTKRPVHPLTAMIERPWADQLVLGDSSGRIEFFRISSKKSEPLAFKLHLSRVNSIRFLDQGNRIISASNDKTVKVYDLGQGSSGKAHPVFLQAFSFKGFALRAEPEPFDGSLAILESRALRLFDLESKAEKFVMETLNGEHLVDCHLLSENALCTVSETAGFKILDKRSGKVERAFVLPDRSVRRTKLARELGRMVCVGRSGQRESVFVLDLLDPSPAKLFELGLPGQTNDLVITDDGRFVALAGQTDPVTVYKLRPEHGIPLKSARQKSANPSIFINTLGKSSNQKEADWPVSLQAESLTRESVPIGKPFAPADLLSQDKPAGPLAEFTFDVSHLVASAKQPDPRTQDNPSAFARRLFPEQPPGEYENGMADELVDLRTLDYNITETKQSRSVHSSLNYKELEEFIKQRQDCLVASFPPADPDFSFKVTTNSRLAEEPVFNQEPCFAPVNDELQKPSDPLTEEGQDNPFADVLGRTFKAREEEQIVIIDQKAVADREVVLS